MNWFSNPGDKRFKRRKNRGIKINPKSQSIKRLRRLNLVKTSIYSPIKPTKLNAIAKSSIEASRFNSFQSLKSTLTYFNLRIAFQHKPIKVSSVKFKHLVDYNISFNLISMFKLICLAVLPAD